MKLFYRAPLEERCENQSFLGYQMAAAQLWRATRSSDLFAPIVGEADREDAIRYVLAGRSGRTRRRDHRGAPAREEEALGACR